VFGELGDQLATGQFWRAVAITMGRGVVGFSLAVVIGVVVGVLMTAIRPIRRSLGSLITGLQTMPSIAWFPLAVLLFKLSEGAILFVVVLGAAPSIANGVVGGADQVPTLLVRYGRSLHTSRWALYRHIVLPAAIPAFVTGLRQGWAFAWRSLMAGELIVIVGNRPSLGARLSFARDFSDARLMLALIIVVLVIGMLVDTAFTALDRTIRRRHGLVEINT
jgi:NitT/TauT family transport system permease protein